MDPRPDEGSVGSSLVVDRGSAAVIHDNDLVGGGPIAVYEGSTPLIQANRLAGGPRIYGEFGDAAVVRGNSITDTPRRSGIILWEGAHALVEDNIITDAGREGIGVRRGAPTIRGNTIARTRANGIEVRQADAGPLIVGNIIVDAGQIGINLVAGAARVEGNTVERAGSTAISVRGSTILDARPAVIGNVLRQDAVAITWGAPAGTVETTRCTAAARASSSGLARRWSPATGSKAWSVEGSSSVVRPHRRSPATPRAGTGRTSSWRTGRTSPARRRRAHARARRPVLDERIRA